MSVDGAWLHSNEGESSHTETFTSQEQLKKPDRPIEQQLEVMTPEEVEALERDVESMEKSHREALKGLAELRQFFGRD